MALDGMSETIERTQAICIACHDFRGMRTHETVQQFLRERGFRTLTRDDDPREYVRDHVYAALEGAGQPGKSPEGFRLAHLQTLDEGVRACAGRGHAP